MEERRFSSAILNLGTSWISVVSFTSHRSIPSETALSNLCTGGCVGPKAGLVVIEKRKSLVPAGK
jgi:hypothetical protein